MTTLLDNAISLGIIDPDQHQPLLDDHVHLCERAGIDTSYLFQSMHDVVPDEAITYVVKYRSAVQQGVFGLAFQGSMKGIPKVMGFMVAAYMRNYVDANLCTVEIAIQDSHRLRPMLAIHDFWVGPTNDYMRGKMVSLLLEREANNLQTVLAISDVSACLRNMGTVMEDCLSGFLVVNR